MSESSDSVLDDEAHVMTATWLPEQDGLMDHDAMRDLCFRGIFRQVMHTSGTIRFVTLDMQQRRCTFVVESMRKVLPRKLNRIMELGKLTLLEGPETAILEEDSRETAIDTDNATDKGS